MARLFNLLVVLCALGGSLSAQSPPQNPPPKGKDALPPIAAARAVADQVKKAQAGETQGGKPAPQAEAPPAPEPPPPTAGQQPAPPTPQQPGAYSYDPQGRRDPFVNLLARGGDVRPAGSVRQPGLAGLLIGELTVKGIVKDRNGFVAMVQAADTKTYIVHSGDKVLDGTVKSIVQDAVVFSQDVNDPLSLVKQREVRKPIRPEAK